MLTWAYSLMAKNITRSNIFNVKTKNRRSKIHFYWYFGLFPETISRNEFLIFSFLLLHSNVLILVILFAKSKRSITSLAFTVISVIYFCYMWDVGHINFLRRGPTSLQMCVCVCVCVCMWVGVCVCVCVCMWRYACVKALICFLPKHFILISPFPILNIRVSEIRVCISTFLLTWKTLFGANKLQFFQGLQWSLIK